MPANAPPGAAAWFAPAPRCAWALQGAEPTFRPMPTCMVGR